MSYDTLNATFFISLATIVCGVAAVGIRYIYKTKCAQCTVCGCIKINRDIEREAQIDLARPNRVPSAVGSSDAGITPMPPMPNISVLTGEASV